MSRRKLSIQIDLDAPPPPPARGGERTAEARLPSRPLRCITSAGVALAHPAWLPFVDASFVEIQCLDQIEYIRREEDFLDEVGRILQPGGRLMLRVPAAGPLAGFDSFNLARYLSDITRRGPRPSETREIGWRKHYSLEHLRQMLERIGLSIDEVNPRGLVASELLHFGAQALFRWGMSRDDAYRRSRTLTERVRRAEHRLNLPVGFSIEIVATKHR